MAYEQEDIVVLDYAELLNEATPTDLAERIRKAFGYDGLGILAVKNVPRLAELRSAALPYGHKFATLPEEIKAKYEVPVAYHAFGWSHGKESTEGVPDDSKGSYYFNAVADKPVEDADLIARYPAFIHPNVWPDEDCSGFSSAIKTLSGHMVSVGTHLARHIDAFVHSVAPEYTNTLATVVKNGRAHKGRLLYYFPSDYERSTATTGAESSGSGASASASAAPSKPASAAATASSTDTTTTTPGKEEFSSWCGWHNDTGSLTALVPAMFFDKDGSAIPCPDPRAGLYIRSRQGKTVRVNVPGDCLAFQIGEAAQIHSGGILQATPHCVKAAEVPGVSRSTLAVFMEPEWDHPMNVPAGRDASEVVKVGAALLPRGVPTMSSRWSAGQDFNDFLSASFAAYHQPESAAPGSVHASTTGSTTGGTAGTAGTTTGTAHPATTAATATA